MTITPNDILTADAATLRKWDEWLWENYGGGKGRENIPATENTEKVYRSDSGGMMYAPPYTTDPAAALALCEKLKLDWRIAVVYRIDRVFDVNIKKNGEFVCEQQFCSLAQLLAAICMALLKTMGVSEVQI